MALNWSEYDPTQRYELLKPGKCHLLVSTVELKGAFYEVTCDIVAHEDETQVGKTTKLRLHQSGKGARRLQDFLIATRVITMEDIQEAINSGLTEIDPEVEEAVGQSFFSVLIEGSYPSKKTGKQIPTCDVQFDFISIFDESASDWPFDPELAPHLANKAKSGGASPTPSEKPQPKKETVPPDNNEVGDDDCPF